MRQIIVILDRPSKHFSKFMDLLAEKHEIRIKDLKRVVTHSSYYDVVIDRLCDLNKVLRNIRPDFYLAEPDFNRESNKVFTALKRCVNIDTIEPEGKCFIIKFYHDED
jgi:hypothetical protein